MKIRIMIDFCSKKAHFKDGISNGFAGRSTRNFTPRRDETRQECLVDVVGNFDASRSIPEDMFVE